MRCVREDAALRRDLTTARSLGMSHRRLLGWTPTEYHATRPDGIVEVSRESEWDPHEAALMAALAEVEADSCPGCGRPLSESLHVDGQPDPEYVDTYVECVGCKASEEARSRRERQRAVDEQADAKTLARIKPDPEAWRKHVIRTRAEATTITARQSGIPPE